LSASTGTGADNINAIAHRKALDEEAEFR